MASRHQVSVYDTEGKAVSTALLDLPSVFTAPIRPDHVRYVHTQLAKNSRQAYGRKPGAGYQTSAESWGTGRAVARIPRVPGGGTHRAGQAAFGNMCRGGGMYSPLKIYRRWHRKVNLNERRHAVASAMAASAVTAIVSARGHRIDAAPEVPLVVSNELETVNKTRDAVALLTKLGLGEELERCKEGKRKRAGKGKARNRKYTRARGPLIVYNCPSDQMKGFNNIPGVDCCHVEKLNLLMLAPGGVAGRMTVFSQSAFEQLNNVYMAKQGYTIRRPMMANDDIARLINSPEIQSVLRPKFEGCKRSKRTLNPLKNPMLHQKLNPAAALLREKAKARGQ